MKRYLQESLVSSLKSVPVTALLGARQVGKTTLALHIAKENVDKDVVYLDLELPSDQNKLAEPESFLKQFENKLLIIDEVQRQSGLFPLLRSLVDIRRRQGEKAGQFLLLGSASRDLLQNTSETLAGRIRYLELTPFQLQELYNHDPTGVQVDKLWFRGGFPESYLAENEKESFLWRQSFISTYVERDIPVMGPRIMPEKMKRFWRMLAHYHGQQVNMAKLSSSLDIDSRSLRHYLDILTDFYMVRQVEPWAGNTKKRLVKSPKIFVRDSGLLHALLNIAQFDDLWGNPAMGASWEGFVAENIINVLPDNWRYCYYRTTYQTEIDLILEGPNRRTIAIEIKHSAAPKVGASFHTACADIGAAEKYVIYNGRERYPMAENTQAIGLIDFLAEVQRL